MLTKEELLEPLARLRGNAVVITCMSVTRPWGKYSASDFDFASADSAMGHTADLALGIALACPQRKVICLNGDGSMLMNLGTLVTAAQAAADNYILFILQNNTYEITGNQSVPGAGFIDFALMARGAGFTKIYSFENAGEYAAGLPGVLSSAGPVAVVVKTKPGSEGPISRSEREPSLYLKETLGQWGRRMKNALQAVTPRIQA
jgi:thiamine pyrophosphate-dependent acetolactate synthase large subunit-like protein